jgi:hypothetical protein
VYGFKEHVIYLLVVQLYQDKLKIFVKQVVKNVLLMGQNVFLLQLVQKHFKLVVMLEQMENVLEI